jgi:hypothetical protein
MPFEKTDLIAYKLLNSSPQVVYDFFEKPATDQKHIFSVTLVDEETEKKLITRNEPLINLAIALFGCFSEVSLQLYNNSDLDIKKAVLHGRGFADGLNYCCNSCEEIIASLIENKQVELLKYFVSNPYLSGRILENLYCKKSFFSGLGVDEHFKLCYATVDHPLILRDSGEFERLFFYLPVVR